MSHSLARLNLIQEAITLGDEDVIVLQSVRLPAEMKGLAELLTEKKYADAAVWIGEYRRDNFAPVEYRDPKIAELQMELANLESVLAELLAEKNEALRKIDAFTAEHNANLGEILGKIFKLRWKIQEKRGRCGAKPGTRRGVEAGEGRVRGIRATASGYPSNGVAGCRAKERN